MRYRVIVFILMVLLVACSRTPQKAATHEKETQKKTVWTEKMEMFLEYDKPIPGQKTVFVVHLTGLNNFKPMSVGTLTLTFRPEKGNPVTVTVNKPERPGIFKTAVLFNEAGSYALSALFKGKMFSDEIIVKNIDVLSGHEKHDGNQKDGKSGTDISFLKEQQWTVDFMIGLPQKQTIFSSLIVPGEIIPVAKAEATVSSPVAGGIALSQRLPYIAQRVAKNEVIAVIAPPISQQGSFGQLAALYTEAKNRVWVAQKEYERAQRLYEAKAVPKRRLEEAEIGLDTAKSALKPIDRAMQEMNPETSGGQVIIKAPFAGTVAELMATNGKSIEAGQPLLRIINTSSVWLKANVPATEIAVLKNRMQATFTIPGIDGAIRPSRFIAVGDVVDSKTRTVPLIFEVANAGDRLKIGMFAEVAITNGQAEQALTLPEEALFEDEGRYFVFVQREGELFSRREVKTAIRAAGRVQIVSGIENNERVVLRGGYYVKLASLSSRLPDAHAGHAH